MSTLDEITKEKQRIAEALARVDARREKLTSQLSELEAAERVLARYSKATPARKTASAKMPTTATKAAAAPRPRRSRTKSRRTSWRQAPLIPPWRSGACFGKWQDAAGNQRCMQGSSPEPCRRRHCPAQAGWPHRRARREALRHAGDGAARRGLIAELKKTARPRCCSQPVLSGWPSRPTRLPLCADNDRQPFL